MSSTVVFRLIWQAHEFFYIFNLKEKNDRTQVKKLVPDKFRGKRVRGIDARSRVSLPLNFKLISIIDNFIFTNFLLHQHMKFTVSQAAAYLKLLIREVRTLTWLDAKH